MKYDTWLVHFFRDRDIENDYSDFSEETYGTHDLPDKATAFQVMKGSLYLGGVLNDCPVAWPWLTLNGLRAAVTAAANGLALMVEGGPKQRQNGVTSYGIAFLTEEFKAVGGQRASDRENYGLTWSVDAQWYFRPSSEDDYILCSTPGIDHAEGPGLPLWSSRETPNVFSKLYLIVESEREAAQVTNILTALCLMRHNYYGSKFDRTLCEATRIVVLRDIRDRYSSVNGGRAPALERLKDDETLPAVVLADEPADADKIVRAAYKRAEQVAQDVSPVLIRAIPPLKNIERYVRVTAMHVVNPMVQYLLKTGRAYLRSDTFEVRLDLEHTWLAQQSLDQIAAVGDQFFRALAEGLDIELEVDLNIPASTQAV